MHAESLRSVAQRLSSIARSPQYRRVPSLCNKSRFASTRASFKCKMAIIEPAPKEYSSWSSEDLIKRVTDLEQQLRQKNEAHNVPQSSSSIQASSRIPNQPKVKPRHKRQFDPTKYNTRYIALKLAYLGRRYQGFEHHKGEKTRLPTVEEKIWEAMSKTKLIFPTEGTKNGVDWNGCNYSKCGRTDTGVSSFGQVIALNVRSSKPLKDYKEVTTIDENGEKYKDTQKIEWDPIKDELEYPRMLNRCLPDDIRVLAWCPAPSPDFSARFSCRMRRYRYFFTNPAFAPRHGDAGMVDRGVRDGWLDIEAMRVAAKCFEGTHDFRNFCKVDSSKQITNFERRIYRAEIVKSYGQVPRFVRQPSFGQLASYDADSADEPAVWEFQVDGSAFLWHQVRHLIAVLFLVGQGLEKPEVVKSLLEVKQNPAKPLYEMADHAPLVLDDCVFPSTGGDPLEDNMPWILPDQQADQTKEGAYANGVYGPGGLSEVLWGQWHQWKISETLALNLLDQVAMRKLSLWDGGRIEPQALSKVSAKVFDGGHGPRLKGDYIPLLQRPRGLEVDEQNRRYAERKGLPDGLARKGRPSKPTDMDD